MKCTVEKTQFLTHLKKVANIVCRKPTLPILANIVLEAEGDSLKLTATDLEIRIESAMKATVNDAGRTTLPARSLLALADRLMGSEINFDSDGKFHCKIKCGNGNFKLLGLDPTDYPEHLDFTAAKIVSVKGNELSRMIDKVAYAVSKDDSRKVLNGIRFAVKDRILTLAATDGKRMAMVEQMLENDTGNDSTEIILPLKTALELKRLFDGDSVIQLQIDDTHVSCECGNTHLTSKLIAGNYPNISGVIPKEFAKNVEIPCVKLASSLDLVSIPLNGIGNVGLHFASNALTLHAENTSVGEGSDQIPLGYEYPDEVNILFNPEYLRDPLRNVGAEKMRFRINQENTPVVLEDGNGFLYILMPIRGK